MGQAPGFPRGITLHDARLFRFRLTIPDFAPIGQRPAARRSVQGATREVTGIVNVVYLIYNKTTFSQSTCVILVLTLVIMQPLT
jgi:hypothetical protein